MHFININRPTLLYLQGHFKHDSSPGPASLSFASDSAAAVAVYTHHLLYSLGLICYIAEHSTHCHCCPGHFVLRHYVAWHVLPGPHQTHTEPCSMASWVVMYVEMVVDD